MKTSRRSFLKLAAAGSFASQYAFTSGGAQIAPLPGAPELGRPYPGWKPGEMDLHFIYTGCGESMFYMLPDGTLWVNDVGDSFRPHELQFIPRLPSAARLGAEWVERYIRRLTPKTHIDYMTVSHWHSDHTGTPLRRSRELPDGRRICGLAYIGEKFSVGHYFDHQPGAHGAYLTQDPQSMKMMEDYVAVASATRGLRTDPFRPGALDQIRLQYDPEGKYAGVFKVRNLCANGVAWTGHGEETADYAAAWVKKTGKPKINQNTLSMALRIDYGKFSFYTGGDVSRELADPATGKIINYEALVAERCGPVTLAKLNHHGTKDAMTPECVKALKASMYVNNVWCPRHIVDSNMSSMCSRTLYGGDRRYFPTFIPDEPRENWPKADWWRDVAPAGHVVVKVAPGGGSFKVFVLSASDETMRVKAAYESAPLA